jgi:hypothetical protein
MSSLGARLLVLGAAYMGDGVYIHLDPGGGVVILTSDGMNVTNQIFLDPETLTAVKLWLKDKKL